MKTKSLHLLCGVGLGLALSVRPAAAFTNLTVVPDPVVPSASAPIPQAHPASSLAVSGDTMVVGSWREQGSATGVNGTPDQTLFEAGAAFVFVRDGSNWVQQAYLKASNTESGDAFGTAVAISGDTIVIGAPGEDSNAILINGNQSNNSAGNSGAAYVFVRSGTNWSQQAYLKASNTDAGDGFGISVAISGDTVVVGAFGEASNAGGVNGNQADNSVASAGAAYVFVRSGSAWSQQAYLKASTPKFDNRFGWAVGIATNTIVVGANRESSSATGINGDAADNSAYQAGAAYVFVRSGSTWSQQAYLKGSNTESLDLFGTSVAVAGNTIVVGAPGEASNATGVDGDQNNNASFNAGAAYVFFRTGSTWSQQAYLKASNTESSDQFGAAVAVHGDNIIVGAPWESSNAEGVNGNQNNNSRSQSGAAYLFNRNGTIWSQQYYLKAAPLYATSGKQFGGRVALTDHFVVIGSVNADEIGLFIDTTPPPPAGPSRIVSLTVASDSVILECLGDPDTSYKLLRRPDLQPETGWLWVGSGFAQFDGTFTVVDHELLPDGAFYRLERED